jgi:hypothetical protein
MYFFTRAFFVIRKKVCVPKNVKIIHSVRLENLVRTLQNIRDKKKETCVPASSVILPLLEGISQLYRKPEIKRWRRVYYTLPAILPLPEGVS